MPRTARVIIPGIPHHVIQRGNRRQSVFFNDQDRIEYLRILKEQGQRFSVSFWAYCLMDNHVHLIAVPDTKDSLAQAIGQTHRQYTRRINFREGWRGYLWQGRFASYPLDETYVYAAVRYVERNPTRAGIVQKAEDYLWSSAKAHVHKIKDPLIDDCFLVDEIKDWSQFLLKESEENKAQIEMHARTGRPLGSGEFIKKMEMAFNRILHKRKPGPKPKIFGCN